MRIRTLIILFIAPLVLSGCPAAVFVGGAAGGIVANDQRTAGSLVEDESIELKAKYEISKQVGSDVNIGVTSYNRRVLLTGQAPNDALKKRVINIVRNTKNVNEIIDEIENGNPSSATARAADAILTGKVKAALCGLQQDNFSCLDVKVVTEKGVLYLLGLVTQEQADIAIETVRTVQGVIKVVKVFEYR